MLGPHELRVGGHGVADAASVLRSTSRPNCLRRLPINSVRICSMRLRSCAFACARFDGITNMPSTAIVPAATIPVTSAAVVVASAVDGGAEADRADLRQRRARDSGAHAVGHRGGLALAVVAVHGLTGRAADRRDELRPVVLESARLLRR